MSYTYGGDGSASIGKQTSTSESNRLTIKGGEVSIQDRGNLQVNNIHVVSLQDTSSSNI
ncbi:hemagglutinin repeat-containing protein [Acinetobacter ursingii]|uniref:hemagglutinin repeat-containing protein n=1 Tax=Acinetobacter ursingii TaxID=108980 RepID=UPI0018DE7588|nr:hemagglutinin repeat-containing protein [Acinetobacter ursingii]QQC83622.1 hemagglutinin repeat-containing protein [Acinetobacter bereziniae]